jgi:hypothetical protein
LLKLLILCVTAPNRSAQGSLDPDDFAALLLQVLEAAKLAII